MVRRSNCPLCASISVDAILILTATLEIYLSWQKYAAHSVFEAVNDASVTVEGQNEAAFLASSPTVPTAPTPPPAAAPITPSQTPPAAMHVNPDSGNIVFFNPYFVVLVLIVTIIYSLICCGTESAATLHSSKGFNGAFAFMFGTLLLWEYCFVGLIPFVRLFPMLIFIFSRSLAMSGVNQALNDKVLIDDDHDEGGHV